MRALVFAAGLGERMRPLTLTTPKPLLDVGGKPLIAWHLEKLAAIGVDDVVVNTSWLAPKFAEALGDKKGIVRFGHAYVPMDETLVRTVVDLSGRSFIVYRVQNIRPMIGTLAVELVEHFWRSFAEEVRCNLHIELLYGANQHHITEAVFKSAARALSAATRTSCLSAHFPGVVTTASHAPCADPSQRG